MRRILMNSQFDPGVLVLVVIAFAVIFVVFAVVRDAWPGRR
jgi:hypothetical protein